MRPDLGTDEIALFLDLDGTLLDIVADHRAASAPDGLVPLIDRIHHDLGGALAIVSGRPIATIDRLLAPLRLPAAGVHGAELRFAHATGITSTAPLPPAVILAIERAVGGLAGIVVEVKRFAVAIHYRQTALAPETIEHLLTPLLASDAHGLTVRRGRKVVEVLPAAVSKGAALVRFMTEPDFAGRKPVMIGDDLTDQSALEAARRLGGKGFRVAGEHFSAAEAEFASPADVARWLAAFARRLDARRQETSPACSQPSTLP